MSVKLDQVSQIIAYEQGDLDEAAIVALFQNLIDSGLAWSLQGHYGRTAANLIALGICHDPSTPLTPPMRPGKDK